MANYSIRSLMYVTVPGKFVDGPRMDTVEAAVTAFANMLRENGWNKHTMFKPIVIDGSRTEVPCADLVTRLRKKGVTV